VPAGAESWREVSDYAAAHCGSGNAP
jgi:hypothetical protein